MQLVLAILVTLVGANAFNMNRRNDVEEDVWKPMDGSAVDFGNFRKPLEFFKEQVGSLFSPEAEETVPEPFIEKNEQWTGLSWWEVLQDFLPTWAEPAILFTRKMMEPAVKGESGGGGRRFLNFFFDILTPKPAVDDHYLRYKVERERELLQQDLNRLVYS